MPTQDSIVSQMRQALQMAEPDLDTAIGSPVRSILDSVAEVIAEQTADQYLLSYQYDINSKSGADLDTFVQLFGLARYVAKSATTFVTLSRGVAANQDIYFGTGTQVATNGNPAVVFAFAVPVSIPANALSVTVPVVCTTAGSIGNVPSASISKQVSPLATITTITNVSAATGGADAETDDMLRERFKKTVFRSLAGTESMFRGVALDDPNVTQVNVVGSAKTYFDQVQISGGVGASSVQDLSYLYPNTDFFGPDITSVSPDILARGTQYTINSYFLPNPAAPTLTQGTGGSLTLLGTYQYAIVKNTQVNAFTRLSTGLGIPVTGTLTGSNNKFTVSWGTTPATPVTSVEVYRRAGTSGAWYLCSNATFPDGIIPCASGPITTATSNGTTITYTAANEFSTGDVVTVTGCADSAYNISGTVSSATNTSFVISTAITAGSTTGGSATTSNTSFVDTSASTLSETPPLNNTSGAPIIRVLSTPLSVGISAITSNGTQITVTPTGGNNFKVGQVVSISGVTPVSFNIVGTIVSTTSLTFTLDSNIAAATGSGGTISYNAVADGMYQLRFDYLPTISRNDPANSVNNKVDVYVNGTRNVEVVQSISWPAGPSTFNTTDGVSVEDAPTSMNVALFQRLDGTNPESGNYFIPLAYAPITNGANTLQPQGSVQVTLPTSGGSYPTNRVYTEGTDYWWVNEVDQYGNGARSRCGLEWNQPDAVIPSTVPNSGDIVSTDYYYNQVPTSVQNNIDIWRLVTTDVMVHSATILPLNAYLGVVLAGNYSPAGVFTAIQTAVSNYLTSITFDGVIQVSNLLSVVQQVSGVAAVRFLTTATDSSAVLYGSGNLNGTLVGTGPTAHYGIQQMNPYTGDIVREFTTNGRAVDIFLDDNELAVLNEVYISQMSNSTFGGV